LSFPAANCDHDAFYAASHNLGQPTEYIWHDSRSLGDVDAVILPGGFAYGDYLRCGAIARFSPVMQAVQRFAAEGGLGARHLQRLSDPGRSRSAAGRADPQPRSQVHLPRAAAARRHYPLAFHRRAPRRAGAALADRHGEGCYFAEPRTLDELEAEDRVAFRYLDNPNGSLRDIAGILSRERNVMGMMPHPERASDPLMGPPMVWASSVHAGPPSQAARPVAGVRP